MFEDGYVSCIYFSDCKGSVCVVNACVCNLGNTISVLHSCKSWIWLFWVELILYSFTYLLSTCIKESVVFLFIFSSSTLLWILCCHLPPTSDFSYLLWFNHHSSHLSHLRHNCMHLIWMMMTAAAHWHIYIYPDRYPRRNSHSYVNCKLSRRRITATVLTFKPISLMPTQNFTIHGIPSTTIGDIVIWHILRK